ncbi:hypothetical protein RirG_086180 [Rhizophagus irregularis DAOM 197198w]|uniref:Uncharacterized protein n=1 Tax=Rhizophagus irregularis (strain DAOM 197198w) TaxID=1432141 RepID=A0A015JTB4_RHIIW|nr:hypothetical protein RirG_086180 [Rhizophagus irregularis DAOM 197198w]
MHPGYVYRPRKNFPTPNPPIHSSDKNSSESLTSTTTSLSPSISEPSTSTKFITSRLAQLSFIKHNQINTNQELPEFHQIFANNNTPKIPQVFSQQRQFVKRIL